MHKLIVSQGRIADRKAGTIEGAACTAKALEGILSIAGTYIGQPSPPECDDWCESLLKAKPVLNQLAEELSAAIEAGEQPVMVANTCPASIATLPVVARKYPDVTLLWIDAHTDFNIPETTKSGYLGGMVVSAACGLWDSGHGGGLTPDQLVMVGVRDIDEAEAELINKHNICIIPPDEATPEVVKLAVGDRPVWLHIDWDVMEPGYIPADYSVEGGISPKQLQSILEILTPNQVKGIELAEYLPPVSKEDETRAILHIVEIISPLLRATLSR